MCSPERLCGVCVGAACSVTHLSGVEPLGAFFRMSNCVQRQTEGSPFPMSCRASLSLCRESRLPATSEAKMPLLTPMQEQPGRLL